MDHMGRTDHQRAHVAPDCSFLIANRDFPDSRFTERGQDRLVRHARPQPLTVSLQQCEEGLMVAFLQPNPAYRLVHVPENDRHEPE